MSAVKSVPEGYPSLSPYLIVRDGAAAIDFYQKVFGATLRMKLDAPGGRVGHAELDKLFIVVAQEFFQSKERLQLADNQRVRGGVFE